ncbi:MAG: S41 family peptidase [Deltaproteobacteria bacterium]
MRRWFERLGLVAVAFAGGALVSAPLHARTEGDDAYRSLAVFARVLNYVENNYVTEIPAKNLIYGAIRGMLATLDAHSAFMDPEQYAAVKSEAQGEFGGIGVELVKRGDRIALVEVYSDGPAFAAGVKAHDRLVEVDTMPVLGRSLAEVVRAIKGPAGSALVLTVERDGVNGLIELSVVRSRIRAVSVDHVRLGDFGKVSIRSFTEHTAQDVKAALDALRESGPIRGLVLDVRDNPGGLLDEAVRIADLWLASGIIVSTEGRGRTPDIEYAHPRHTQPDYPIVVLVNGGTASASEIVAGALQDHHRGVVLGTQTFGKGSVQTVIELEDHSALKLTIAKYFTPAHRSIQGTGITPDVVVPVSRSKNPAPVGRPTDNQLDAALTLLERWRAGAKP